MITYQTGEKISRNNGKSSVRYWNSSTSASAFSAAFGYDMFLQKMKMLLHQIGAGFYFLCIRSGFFR
ncbi:hypothetical protein UA45_00575 [Morganella morganii]|uniref:Uncharacterized protein n=1 Tax=Morganella morganii TaxID=582 RepID=A0A0D8LBA8_MORMO|nr:hypothetical protein UA45_00575 [Morganella morganii]